MKTTHSYLKNGTVKIVVRSTEKHSEYGRIDEYDVDEYAEKFVVGETTCFIEWDNVSPNALRSNENFKKIQPSHEYDKNGKKIPNILGIRGNSNGDIRRFHGWRGTTSDQFLYAIGLRTVLSNTKLKRGYGFSIILSNDLAADQD